MKICSALKTLLITSSLVLTFATELNALPLITWMSGGTGDDANPGSRSFPTLTLAATITKTNAGGQISAIDAGNYGGVTISKAITIDGSSVPFEIIVAGSIGINVTAGPNDVVILRHILLNGVEAGTTAIQFTSGQQLIIEDCNIVGFTGTDIVVNLTNAANVVIRNTTISGGTTGISVNGTTSPVNVLLDGVSIEETTTSGVDALLGFIDVNNSSISQNSGIGVLADGTSLISCKNTLFASNSTAIQANPGATIRISNNDFYDNVTGIANGGGTIATANNNREAGSTTPGSPTTSIVFQ